MAFQDLSSYTQSQLYDLNQVNAAEVYQTVVLDADTRCSIGTIEK